MSQVDEKTQEAVESAGDSTMNRRIALLVTLHPWHGPWLDHSPGLAGVGLRMTAEQPAA